MLSVRTSRRESRELRLLPAPVQGSDPSEHPRRRWVPDGLLLRHTLLPLAQRQIRPAPRYTIREELVQQWPACVRDPRREAKLNKAFLRLRAEPQQRAPRMSVPPVKISLRESFPLFRK